MLLSGPNQINISHPYLFADCFAIRALNSPGLRRSVIRGCECSPFMTLNLKIWLKINLHILINIQEFLTGFYREYERYQPYSLKAFDEHIASSVDWRMNFFSWKEILGKLGTFRLFGSYWRL